MENNCSFCQKVQNFAKGFDKVSYKYYKCRPHAMLESFEANACRNCEFENDRSNCDRITCSKGLDLTPLQMFSSASMVDGKYVSKIRDEALTEVENTTDRVFIYEAGNGNIAVIVNGAVVYYRYGGAVLKNE